MRESEWSVVATPAVLAETVAAQSQQGEGDLSFDRCEGDLGSRDALRGETDFLWSPAEADVSVTTGWFYHGRLYYLFRKKRTAKHLAEIYFNTVGGNASLLLNVPPNKKGEISRREQHTLRRWKRLIDAPFGAVIPAEATQPDAAALQLSFEEPQPVSALVLSEDTAFSQRVEQFTVWALCGENEVRRVAAGTTIGRKKIVRFCRPVQTNGLFVTFDSARGEPKIRLCEAWKKNKYD